MRQTLPTRSHRDPIGGGFEIEGLPTAPLGNGLVSIPKTNTNRSDARETQCDQYSLN